MLRLAVFALSLSGCSADNGKFKVRFDVETTAGAQSFNVVVTESWAPIGAARFRELVEAGCEPRTTHPPLRVPLNQEPLPLPPG